MKTPSVLLSLALLILLGAPSALALKEPDPENVSISELRQKAVELDKKIVRVKFHYRGNISQMDADRYYVRLYDKDYHQIWVEFPKEALNAFKRMPTSDKYSENRALYVFGTVRTPGAEGAPSYFYSSSYLVPVILDALGTNLSKNISGAAKYVW